MKIVIADDEALARERLARMVKEIDQNNCFVEAANGFEVIEKVNEDDPELVLLDIRMPGMSGMEVARHLGTMAKPPAIVFTTAYDEYALEAFETNAIAYLLKPVRKHKLEQALVSCRQLNKLQLGVVAQQGLETNPGQAVRSHISVRVRGMIVLIPVADILYFIADQKYVSIKYKKQGRIAEAIIEETLKSLEQEFGTIFLRIHRNALIRRELLESLHKQADGKVLLTLRNVDAKLEVSRRHLSMVRKLMK